MSFTQNSQKRVHIVERNETLTSIGKKHGDIHWRPIWNYNRQIRPTLGEDPNSIRVGDALIIPWSKAVYSEKIKRLSTAKRMADTDCYIAAQSLKSNFYRLKATDVLIELASEAATIGVKVASAAMHVSTARTQFYNAVGRDAVAAEYLLNAQIYKLHKLIASQAMDKVIDAIISAIGTPALADAKKLGTKIVKSRQAISRVSTMNPVRTLTDIYEILPDEVTKPTRLARLITGLLYSDTPESATQSALQQLDTRNINAFHHIEARINALSLERDLVYPNATTDK